MMNLLTIILSCLFMLYSIYSYPLNVSPSSKLANLPPSQINHLCSYISQLQEQDSSDLTTIKSESRNKRFVMPFPDMNRFLSTSHKLHHHHHQSDTKSKTELSNTKHDFQAYLCSITKDSEEMTNFISIFIEEHGQPPAFNIFESCEPVEKRDLLESNINTNNGESSIIRLNELLDFCSNRVQTQVSKRGKHTVGGPISIDFIHQMLESRKVQSYPYRAEVDPYLVGR